MANHHFLNLLHEDSHTLTKVANTNGGEYAGACPWCGGEDRFRTWPEEGEYGRYWCRGCDRKGDAIQYLKDYRKLSYPDACEIVGKPASSSKPETVIVDGVTLEELAEAKGLDIDVLKSLGWQTKANYYTTGKPAVTMPYYDESGERHKTHCRIDLTKDKRFRWSGKGRMIPYGLPHLHLARELGYITLIEGETDFATAYTHGIPVLALPGAATWNEEWNQYLAEIADVYIWQETPKEGQNADAGWKMVRSIGQFFPDAKVIQAPPEAKDINELAQLLGNDFESRFEELRQEAIPFHEIEAAESTAQHNEDYEIAHHLLVDPALLHKRVKTMQSLGVAGEEKNLAILDLALISRALPQILNTCVQGAYSSGKNFIINAARRLHPREAVHELSASSELALVYTTEPLEHRIVYFQEYRPGDYNSAGSLILRSIAWDGYVSYETVESTKEGLRSKRIEKDGPTGLMVTTTRTMEPELASRFLTIETSDSPEHLNKAVGEILKQYTGDSDEILLEEHVAVSRYCSEPQMVVIPWANWLKDKIETTSPSVLRHLQKFLFLIQASAVLHQEQRGRDTQGRIIATPIDYAMAHTLAADIFESQQEDITSAQRQAVEAVIAIHEETRQSVSYTDVAKSLNISVSAASRRLRGPKSQGYVIDNETRKGRPAQLQPGIPLPNRAKSLPPPEELAKAFPEYGGLFVNPLTGEEWVLGTEDSDPSENDCNTAKVPLDITDLASVSSETEAQSIAGGVCKTHAIPDTTVTYDPPSCSDPCTTVAQPLQSTMQTQSQLDLCTVAPESENDKELPHSSEDIWEEENVLEV